MKIAIIFLRLLIVAILLSSAHTFVLAQTESWEQRHKKYPALWEGKDFPSFRLKNLRNKTVNRGTMKGKIVVFNFWFIACRPCIEEMPQLNQVVDHFKRRDDIIFLAPAHNPAVKLLELLTKHEFKYETLHSDEQLSKETLQILAYPAHFVVDRNGKVRWVKIGALEHPKELITVVEQIE